MTKIIYFTETEVPTPEDEANIFALRRKYEWPDGSVRVVYAERASPLYGSVLEPADGLAGAIPDSYKTGTGNTIDPELYPLGEIVPVAEGQPDPFSLVGPDTFASGSINLRAVGVDNAGELIDFTPDEDCVFSSSNDDVATVTNDGLVTKVAAGDVTITATYEFGEDQSVFATKDITVT